MLGNKYYLTNYILDVHASYQFSHQYHLISYQDPHVKVFGWFHVSSAIQEFQYQLWFLFYQIHIFLPLTSVTSIFSPFSLATFIFIPQLILLARGDFHLLVHILLFIHVILALSYFILRVCQLSPTSLQLAILSSFF